MSRAGPTPTGTRAAPLPLATDTSVGMLPWVIAVMTFLAIMALAVALVVGRTAGTWQSALTGTLTVQLPPVADVDRDPLPLVLDALRSTPGVAEARALPVDELVGLVEPWLGDVTVADALPLPRLIDVTLRQDVAIDMNALIARVRQIDPTAQVDDHQAWLRQVLVLLDAARAVALLAVALIGVAAVLIVVFATRAGLAAHRDVIGVLHTIGARDRYIAAQFQRHVAGLALRGAALGGGLAAATLLALAWAHDPGLAPLLPDVALTLADWVAVGAVPTGLVLLAMATARRTVLRELGRLV